MFYCPEAKGIEELSPGFQPISADIMRGASTGEWLFVPDGQSDRSEAGCAWIEMPRGPVPGGTIEGMVSSRDNLSSKRSPGLSKRQRSIQSSRWDGAIFRINNPGTSCLATIGPSLRDKRHSSAEVLLKLAFIMVG
jgi:hypothetical protein